MGGIFLAKAPHSPFVLGGVACGSSSSSSCAGEMAEILLMLSMVVNVFPHNFYGCTMVIADGLLGTLTTMR